MSIRRANNWVTGDLLDDIESPQDTTSGPQQHSPEPTEDTNGRSSPVLPPESATPKQKQPQTFGTGRLVLAVDYGTTFTGVAWATATAGEVELGGIEVLQEWTKNMGNHQKVRSAISYNTQPAGDEAQWGTDICKNSVSMINTKLELEPQDTLLDELDLTFQVLEGTGYLRFAQIREVGSNPEYTFHPPVQIICDYLGKIRECICEKVDFETLRRTNTPIDIVVTAPVGWSYLAVDALYKALRGAGLNNSFLPTLRDTILISEAEAAAYFTARDIRDRNPGTGVLRKQECFVLCDAGGGTVDVVSLQVNRIKSHLELEKATKPTGGKCGSTLIDTAFKGWLRGIIGPEAYAHIDPASAWHKRISPHAPESGAMRELIKRFNVKKHVFSNANTADIKLDLPTELNGLSAAEKVKDGELTITWAEMKDLMDTCVNEVIGLIMAQVDQVGSKKERRVKNVFLVGGFGASPYLREELQKSLARRKMHVHRPQEEESLTAVVQGAVIYGVEKGRHADFTRMSSLQRSFGIVRQSEGNKVFEWLFRRGDLILSNEERAVTSHHFWHRIESAEDAGCSEPNRFPMNAEFLIFVFIPQMDEEDDDVPDEWQTGKHEVKVVGSVTYDFSSHANQLKRRHPLPLRPGVECADLENSRLGPLAWHFVLSAQGIEARVMFQGQSLGSCHIGTDIESLRGGPGEAGWSDEDSD